jgi:hypothetical protein
VLDAAIANEFAEIRADDADVKAMDALCNAALWEAESACRDAIVADAVEETEEREMTNWEEADAKPIFEPKALAEATKPEHSGRIAACGCAIGCRLLRNGAGVIRPGSVSRVTDKPVTFEAFLICNMTKVEWLTSWSSSCCVLFLSPFFSLRKTVQPFSMPGEQVICYCDNISNSFGWDQDRWAEFLDLIV